MYILYDVGLLHVRFLVTITHVYISMSHSKCMVIRTGGLYPSRSTSLLLIINELLKIKLQLVVRVKLTFWTHLSVSSNVSSVLETPTFSLKWKRTVTPYISCTLCKQQYRLSVHIWTKNDQRSLLFFLF